MKLHTNSIGEMIKNVSMSIDIKDVKPISEIQLEFSSVYPYLKIEFYKKRLNKSEANAFDKMLPSELTLREIRRKHKEGLLSLDPDRTVADLEKELEQEFGLHTQVFRKSGNHWIETCFTGNWTLRTQNKEGYEISKGLPKKNPLSELTDAIDSNE